MQNNNSHNEPQNSSSAALKMEDPLYSSLVANIVFNACLCYSTTMLNITSIYALRKTFFPSQPVKIFIVNLAISDLGVGLLGEPLYIAYLAKELRFKFLNGATFIVTSIIWNLLYLSSFCGIMVLHADRFVAISMPLRHNELVTRKRAVIMVTAIWLFIVLLVLSCVLMIPDPRITLVTFDIIVLLCLLTSTWSSYKIFATIRRHKTAIQAQVQQVAQNTSMENLVRLRKSAQSTFWIYLVFCICYLPNVFLEIVDQIYVSASMSRHALNIFLLTLMFLNSSLNPVIYCWKLRHIRHTMLGLLENIFHR